MKQITKMVFIAIGLVLSISAQAQVNIHKKWVIGNEEDGLSLIDLTSNDTLVRASAPNAEDAKESRGAKKAGVFYQTEKAAYRVVPTSKTAGDIEFKLNDGTYASTLSYFDLNENKVTFLFEGEFEWEAHADNSIAVVNPNTLELNIDDMTFVFNYRQFDENAMQDLCKGKNMRRIALQENGEDGTIELWGRGLSLDGTKVVRSGTGEALGIIYKKKADEYIEVAIMFSDEKLIKEYENQLAFNCCFPRRTREINDKKEVTYASKYWEEESDEPAYILTDDHKGLYTISYFVME